MGFREREFFVDNLLVRIHFIIVMIRWTGLAPWDFEFPFPGGAQIHVRTPSAGPPRRPTQNAGKQSRGQARIEGSTRPRTLAYKYKDIFYFSVFLFSAFLFSVFLFFVDNGRAPSAGCRCRQPSAVGQIEDVA